MTVIRSVLWIGEAKGLEESPVAGAPTVDLAWAAELSDALALPLGSFDCVVMDAREDRAARAGRERLRTAGARTVLLTADPSHYPQVEDLDHARRSPPAMPGVIGRSPALLAALDLAARAQRTGATVLLTGETGTGKELVARAIHAGSARGEGAFVAVNCAAFPDTLLESELFGHVRGAFTGADRSKEGLFQLASGGTLLLDEVGETSGPFQAKLLRVLQEGEVRPVGGSRSRRVDVRIIAATHRDLRREIDHGHFREDLYYRLSVFPIEIPPLRARREDILPLARHFLERHGAREKRPGCTLDAEAARLMRAHPWPGNVRELENEIQRALALSEPGDAIGPDRLSLRLSAVLEPAREVLRPGETLRESMARVEAFLLERALSHHDGRRAATARALGLTREGLYKKMKRLGIE